MKITIKEVMAMVVELIEVNSAKSVANFQGPGRPIAPVWSRKQILSLFHNVMREQYIERKWSDASIMSCIPQFYGRLLVTTTKEHGKHQYTPARFYETAVEVLVIRNDRVKRESDAEIARLKKKLSNFKKLYHARGRRVYDLLVEAIKVICCQRDDNIKRDLGI